MGVLNIPQPQIPQRNQMGSQLAVTALEMLLKKYMDKQTAIGAETGANQFLNQREGLPTETTETPTGTIREDLKLTPLEETLSTKKEGPGLPTPPAQPTETPELDKVLTPEVQNSPIHPENPVEDMSPVQNAYMRNLPPQVTSPKMQVAPGQTTEHYGAAIQQATAPRYVEVTDTATGIRRLEEKKAGMTLGPAKTSGAGQAIVYDKQGRAFAYDKSRPGSAPTPINLAGGDQLAKETATDSRTAYAQEQQRGRFQTYYDPKLGYSRPYSSYELRQTLEGPAQGPTAMPNSSTEAAKINALAGRQVAVFNASENARNAAKVAVAKNGRLNFRDGDAGDGQTSLAQMASLIARLTHSNDVVDSNLVTAYMHGLVNNAMDNETRNYANHLLTMYEAAVGANGILGGSNQTSDMRYRALLAALPSPVDSRIEDIEGKINRFQTDVALSVSSQPNIKSGLGYTVHEINKDLQEVHAGKPYDQSIIAKLAGQGGITMPIPQAQQPTQRQQMPSAAPKVRRFRADGTEY